MLRWFQALMPKEERFFDLFERHAATVVAGAEALGRLLDGGDIAEQCRIIAAREQEADDIAREVLEAVRRSFITPFDRSDISDLIGSMDDAIDQMHKTAKAIGLFDLSTFEPYMRDMGAIIVEAARLVAEAVPLLRSLGANAGRLHALTERVIQIEERSDELHEAGLKAVLQTYGRSDPMAYIIGSEIYGHLEKIVDRFEDVANEIHGIVLEHV